MQNTHTMIAIEHSLTDRTLEICHEIKWSGYRQNMSVSAFFYTGKGYNESDTSMYTGIPFRDAWMKTNVDDLKHDVNFIKHDSIWDFYNHIGYDYKKKEYLKCI